jgi:hypothetical protein
MLQKLNISLVYLDLCYKYSSVITPSVNAYNLHSKRNIGLRCKHKTSNSLKQCPLYKLIFTNVINKFPPFMDIEYSLQEHTTNPCFEPHAYSPYPRAIFN